MSCPALYNCYKATTTSANSSSTGTGICSCYRFYSLTEQLAGKQEDSGNSAAAPDCVVKKDSSFTLSLIFLTIGLVVTSVGIASAVQTAYVLKSKGALGWGPRDRVLIYMMLSAPSHLGNFGIYYLNLFGMDDQWDFHDGWRPTCFALTTLFLVMSILEVVVMWLDLVKKASSMRKDTTWLEFARKVARAYSLAISLFVFSFGLVLSNFSIMAPGIAVAISSLSLLCFLIGKKLVTILVPEFHEEKGRENQNYPIAYAINTTRIRVSVLCFLTFVFLGCYTVSVKKAETGAAPFIFTMCWVGITLPLVQISLLAYVRFGARKLLGEGKSEKERGGGMLKRISFVGRLGEMKILDNMTVRAKRSLRKFSNVAGHRTAILKARALAEEKAEGSAIQQLRSKGKEDEVSTEVERSTLSTNSLLSSSASYASQTKVHPVGIGGLESKDHEPQYWQSLDEKVVGGGEHVV